jgi:hypothetical protein
MRDPYEWVDPFAAQKEAERRSHFHRPSEYFMVGGEPVSVMTPRIVHSTPTVMPQRYTQGPMLSMRYVKPPWWKRALRRLAFWRRWTVKEER